MEYSLKDKLIITKDFIEELTEKSWQEIEHIQSQITNLAGTAEGNIIKKLLNNLLTSYYVFVGGLENYDSNVSTSVGPVEAPTRAGNTNEPVIELTPDAQCDSVEVSTTSEAIPEVSMPFEYFTDFDDPIGDPLTDEDLYNN